MVPALAKPIAALTPTKRGSTSVAVDTAFRLRSLDGTAARTLADRLTVEPAVALRRWPGGSADTVILTPGTALRHGQTYRFTLHRADGSVAGSWMALAAAPLRVAGTIPTNEATGVPVKTGIEVTFDQGGVRAAAFKDAFTISPSAKGRVEAHGRSLVFVPSRPLKAMTVYTVTIRHGLPVTGTGETLLADVRFQFETAGRAGPEDELHFWDRLVDSATTARPVLFGSMGDDEDGPKVSRTVRLTIHRLPTATAAADAYRTLTQVPYWASSGDAPIKTAALPLVGTATVTAVIDPDSYSAAIPLPTALKAGWYVVTVDHGQKHQVIVQSSDIAAYALLTNTRTVVWANSLRTGRPVVGASVRIAERAVGTTDADGLLITDTPAATKRDATDDVGVVGDRVWFVSVRVPGGQAVIVPLDTYRWCGSCEDDYSNAAASDDHWVVLAVDREQLRSTDHANIWGIIRTRAGGRVPSDVAVELRIAEWDKEPIAIVTESVTPSATGMFTASVPLVDVPLGSYEIALTAGGKTIATHDVHVVRLVKPAWQLSISTDRRAVLDGGTVRTTATATFFDGTPVAGADLIGSDAGESHPISLRTNIDGVATGDIQVTMDDEDAEGWTWSGLGIDPRLPEEADIHASAPIAVFLADVLMAPSATVSGTTLTASGRVAGVDWAAMNAVTDPEADVDPMGAPSAGASVRVAITEVIPVRKQVGTRYDPITKLVEPRYDWTEKRVSLGTQTVVTGPDGRFRLTRTVHGGDRWYEVAFSTSDASGRTVRYERTAFDEGRREAKQDWPELVIPGVPDDEMQVAAYSVGDPVTVTLRGGAPVPATDRYLFTVAQNGLRSATVQAGPTFRATFADSWIPNMVIAGVRFNGSYYEVPEGDATATVDLADHALRVAITADAPRHAPGGRATVTVRTTTPGGTPVAATVVVRAVDEKLFAMGAAVTTDTLSSLYREVASGKIRDAWSHGPESINDGWGDTGGGGGDMREDFRDWLVFQQVTTGADGRATVSFDLSDDLTSWRVLASAVDSRLRAGDAQLMMPVGLPFFAEAVLADTYVAGDQPILRVRGYGDALQTGQTVTFVVSMPDQGMDSTTVTARAFTAASVPLPRLTAGDHQVRIVASVGSGASRHEDRLGRTLHVVATRALQGVTRSATLSGPTAVPGGSSGLTTVALVDGGRGRVIPLLLDLVYPNGVRRDEVLAGHLAGHVLTDVFGMPVATPTSSDSGLLNSESSGIGLVPYGSVDLRLSALAALTDDPAVDPGGLAEYLEEVGSNEDHPWVAIEHLTRPTPAREQRIIALAGLAALGKPVLADIRIAVSLPKLTLIERTWLALAAYEAGDVALATRLERDLLADRGQRAGPWVRLSAPSAETSATTTAILAIVAAGISDPLAADMDAYLEANPPRDTLVVLERALAAREWAQRAPAGAASASLSMGGTTRRLDIRPGEPVWLTLTPAQVASARLTPISGTVVMTSSWEAPLRPDTLDRSPVATLTRSITPSGLVPIDGLVTVTYTARLRPSADKGCWLLTDMVPSGLVPLERVSEWRDEDDGPSDTAGPWQITGQRVDFCVDRTSKPLVTRFRYLARVVTPGTFRWEPAVLQSSLVPTQGAIVAATTLTIGEPAEARLR